MFSPSLLPATGLRPLTMSSPLASRNTINGKPAFLPPNFSITSSPPVLFRDAFSARSCTTSFVTTKCFSRMALFFGISINLSSRRHHPHHDASKVRKIFFPSLAASDLALLKTASAEGAAETFHDARQNASISDEENIRFMGGLCAIATGWQGASHT